MRVDTRHHGEDGGELPDSGTSSCDQALARPGERHTDRVPISWSALQPGNRKQLLAIHFPKLRILQHRQNHIETGLLSVEKGEPLTVSLPAAASIEYAELLPVPLDSTRMAAGWKD